MAIADPGYHPGGDVRIWKGDHGRRDDLLFAVQVTERRRGCRDARHRGRRRTVRALTWPNPAQIEHRDGIPCPMLSCFCPLGSSNCRKGQSFDRKGQCLEARHAKLALCAISWRAGGLYPGSYRSVRRRFHDCARPTAIGPKPLRVTHWQPLHGSDANLACVYDSLPRGSRKPRTLI
jgi:hypothetical protein